MSIADAISRIDQIQQQMAQLSAGGVPSAAGAASATSTAASPAAGATSPAGSSSSASNFAGALALAQASSAAATQPTTSTTGLTPAALLSSAASPSLATSPSSIAGLSTAAGSAPASSSASSALLAAELPALATSGSGYAGASPYVSALTGAAPASPTGATLPATAGTMLTSDQQQFAQTLAADTGLDPGVVSAWLLAEESGSAAQSRQAQGNNDWLNIGYTDSGTYGASDSVWADPVTAANATAGWLRGQATIPGYGTASAGIQAILQTAGQAPQSQIAALQGSGWASSGYPDLPALYTQVAG